MDGHDDNLTFSSRSFEERYHGNRFLARIAKICIPRLHSVQWHSTTDGRIAMWMHALTSPIIPLVWQKFAPVTLSFAGAYAPGRLHAWLCHAFLVSDWFDDALLNRADCLSWMITRCARFVMEIQHYRPLRPHVVRRMAAMRDVTHILRFDSHRLTICQSAPSPLAIIRYRHQTRSCVAGTSPITARR